jgi:protein-disulfide isomerase
MSTRTRPAATTRPASPGGAGPASLTARLRSVAPWLTVAARLLLAAVLGYAALTKIGDPAATVRAVRAYQLLPESIVPTFAHALPAVELAVAALLLVGLALRLAAVASAVLLTMFVIGIASAAARGLRIDCGCFGGGGATAHPQYTSELVRDVLLLAVAVAVVVWPRSRLALDPAPVVVPAERLPDGPSEPSRSEQRRQRTAHHHALAAAARRASRMWVHVGVAVAVLLVSAVSGVAASSSTSVSASSVIAPAGVTSHGGVLVGSSSAPHHLILFEDPQCPICGQFETTSGSVVAQAVAAGTVQVEYRMRSFLGPESVRADAALGAAQQVGKFAQLRAWLFAHQPAEHTGGFSVADLLAAGPQVGLTGAALSSYDQQVSAQTYAAWARSVDDQASKDGNVGTPELRLDGHTLDNTVAFNATALAKALA